MHESETQGYDERPELVEARRYAALGGRGTVLEAETIQRMREDRFLPAVFLDSHEALRARSIDLGQLSAEADEAIHEYAYWISNARKYAENPNLGYASETYRAATQMAYRALGRYDALAGLIGRATEVDGQ